MTKKTSELIPLCHLLNLTKLTVDFTIKEETNEIEAACIRPYYRKDRCGMEALTGVNIALLTIYDMCKAIDKHMVMTDIHLVEEDRRQERGFCI
mgnify:CR=1 FL=1